MGWRVRHALACGPVVAWCALLAGTASAETAVLGARERVRVERALFPLPHDLRFGARLYRFAPGACAFSADGLTPLQTQFVEDFGTRWADRYGAELAKGAPAGPALRIFAGIAGVGGRVKQAAADGAFDPAYLTSRPNLSQAYAISAVPGASGGLDVCLAANDSPGLYYALITFEQIAAALATKGAIVVPEIGVVDWPDLEERAIACGGEFSAWHFRGRLAELGQVLYRLSAMKANLHYDRIDIHTKDDRTVTAQFPTETLPVAERYSITFAPMIGHLAGTIMAVAENRQRFPGAVNVVKAGEERQDWTWCFSHPESQEFIDRIFEAVARDVVPCRNFMYWFSEIEGPTRACYCDTCGGDLRKQWVGEIEHVMRAYRKAQAAHPAFRMDDIGLTQGTYPYNLDILPHIPKDIHIMEYDGCWTYSNDPLYLIRPSIQEMVWRGYRVGATETIKSGLYTKDQYMIPFLTPLFVKRRVGEMVDCGLMAGAVWAGYDFDSFNLQALAEFMWNARGRGAREFAASWAQRQGYSDPELAADIVQRLEYPNLAVSNCASTRSLSRLVERLAESLLRRDRNACPEILRGFEFCRRGELAHDELARLLNNCGEATEAAKPLPPEFALGCVVLTDWIAIFERYAFAMQNTADDAAWQQGKTDVLRLTDTLEQDWRRWFDVVKPSGAEATISMYDPRHIPRIQEEFAACVAALRRLDGGVRTSR